MPELMDQQCRLVQSLQHQTECPYRYLREYESLFRIVFYHCWNKSGLVISFGVSILCIIMLFVNLWFMYTCEGGFCLQNYSISSELKLSSRLEI